MAVTNSQIRKHLTTLSEWRKMGEAGVFPADSRLELINGEVLEMSPIGSQHASHLKRLFHYFAKKIDFNDALLSIQDPLQLNNLSEPEPDLMLLQPDPGFYQSQHPKANNVLLLVEIADTSLFLDQNLKLQLYAQHNIPEYWIMNLLDNTLEVYRQPQGKSYEFKNTLRAGDTIKLLKLPEISAVIDDLL